MEKPYFQCLMAARPLKSQVSTADAGCIATTTAVPLCNDEDEMESKVNLKMEMGNGTGSYALLPRTP